MLVLQVSVHHDAGATGQCTVCWCYRSMYSILVLQVSVHHDDGSPGQCTVCWWYKSVYNVHHWCRCYWSKSVYIMMLVVLVIVQYAGATSQCSTSWCQCYCSVYSMLLLQVSVQYIGATSQCTSWCWYYVLVSVHNTCASNSVNIRMLVLLVSVQYAIVAIHCQTYSCYL